MPFAGGKGSSPLTVQATVVTPFESVTLTGVQDIAVIGQWSPLQARAGVQRTLSFPLDVSAATKHRRRSPLVVEAGVRRRSRRPIDVIGLYWYRVPIPAPTYGGDD